MSSPPRTFEEAEEADVALPELIPAVELTDEERERIRNRDGVWLWTADDIEDTIGPVPVCLELDRERLQVYVEGALIDIVGWIRAYLSERLESSYRRITGRKEGMLIIDGPYGEVESLLYDIPGEGTASFLQEVDRDDVTVTFDLDPTEDIEDTVRSMVAELLKGHHEEPIQISRRNPRSVLFLRGDRKPAHDFLVDVLEYVDGEFRTAFRETWKEVVDDGDTVTRYRIDWESHATSEPDD
ncbi:MAG: hypothetical protein ABEJ73_04100 [Haloplanus sp.]